MIKSLYVLGAQSRLGRYNTVYRMVYYRLAIKVQLAQALYKDIDDNQQAAVWL